MSVAAYQAAASITAEHQDVSNTPKCIFVKLYSTAQSGLQSGLQLHVCCCVACWHLQFAAQHALVGVDLPGAVCLDKPGLSGKSTAAGLRIAICACAHVCACAGQHMPAAVNSCYMCTPGDLRYTCAACVTAFLHCVLFTCW